MMKNMKQMNKLLEQVNKDLNAGELTKVMDKFEQVNRENVRWNLSKKTMFFFLLPRLSKILTSKKK